MKILHRFILNKSGLDYKSKFVFFHSFNFKNYLPMKTVIKNPALYSLLNKVNDQKIIEKSTVLEFFLKLKTEFSTFHLSFYLSDTDRNSNLINQKLYKSYIEKIKVAMIDGFGGLTVQLAQGYYKNLVNKIIKENITIFSVHSFEDKISLKSIEPILELLIEYSNICSQECLLISINNKVNLVYI